MTNGGEIRGRVAYESSGQPDAEVLALDAADDVIASAATDQDGSFVLGLPAGKGPARLFARCRGPVAGVATCSIAADATGEVALRMDAHAHARRLEIALADGVRPGREPFVRLLPLAIGDLGPETMRLVLARVGDVANSALESRAMTGGILDRQVLAGRWWFRIDLSEAWEGRPTAAGKTTSWVADGAWDAGGAPLRPLDGGYEVEIDQGTRVYVHLSPVERAPA